MAGIIFLFTGTLVASDRMLPAKTESYSCVPAPLPDHLKNNNSDRLERIPPRDPPEYEFVVFPTPLVTAYYDYMPGSYDGHPIKLQAANGGEYEGIYFVFHGQPGSIANNRRVYWGYADSYTDTDIEYGLITSYDKRQGYPGLDIHPASGDAIVSWHENIFPESGNDCAVTYDDYDLMMLPGFWQDPMGIPQPPEPNREYIWPYIYVGPSPEPGYVRVYHISNNSEMDNACEHTRLMYTDVPNDAYVYSDMEQILELANWSEPIYIFRDWAEQYEIRPYPSFSVSWDEPGKVAFMGYAGYLMDEPTGEEPVDPGFYVWESYNYGETWDYANLHSYYPFMNSMYVLYEIENVPGFIDDNGEPYPNLDVFVGWPGSLHTGHHSALYDGEGNLHMPILLWIAYVDEVGGSAYYWPVYLFHFQAEIVYMADGTWELRYVADLPGTDPLTGTPVPWPDSETVYPWLDISTSNVDIMFHENIQHQAVNKENGWLVQVWVNGTEMLKAENSDVVYPDPTDPNYLGHPIIYVAASRDNGATWSDPIELSDIYSEEFPDFANQITVYPYVAPQIVDLGDNWGQIFMYYFDDNDYGSFIHNQGPPTGGNITWMSIKIDFSTIPPGIEEEPEVVSEFVVANYPNPFSTSTRISFTLPVGKTANPQVTIYNTRGQLVRSLAPEQTSEPREWQATWDGKDMHGSSVANGIYFYKVETSLGTGSGKMLLMK